MTKELHIIINYNDDTVEIETMDGITIQREIKTKDFTAFRMMNMLIGLMTYTSSHDETQVRIYKIDEDKRIIMDELLLKGNV